MGDPHVRNRETVRRNLTLDRTTGVPDLAVQADQDASRGYQALSSAAVGIFGRINDTLQQHQDLVGSVARENKAKQDKLDEAAGARDRQNEQLSGKPAAALDALAEHTNAYIRGYRKLDGLNRLDDAKGKMLEDISKAEPDADIQPIIQQHLGEVFAQPEFQDPEVRAALTPAIAQVAQDAQETHLKLAHQESIRRTDESLTKVAEGMAQDGTLFTAAGQKSFYALGQNPQFAGYHRSELDEVMANATINILQQGNADPKKALEFLKQDRPDGTPGLYFNRKVQDKLDMAAKAGEAVIAKRLDDARNVMAAESETKLRAAADNGVLTQGSIIADLKARGVTPESDPKQYVSELRYWSNQNDQTLKERATAARARQQHADIQAMLSRNPYEVPQAKAEKALEKMYEGAKTNEQKNAVIAKAFSMGLRVPQLNNILDRASPGAPGWEEAVRLRDALQKTYGANYAARYTSPAVQAQMDEYTFKVKQQGYSPQSAAASLNVPKVAKDEARANLKQAWDGKANKATREMFSVSKVDGKPYSQSELNHLLDIASDIMAQAPSVTPQGALRSAKASLDAQMGLINGRRVPLAGMPRTPQGIAATEALLETVAKEHGVKKDQVFAVPAPGSDGKMWRVVGPDGWWLETKKGSGKPIDFNPQAVAAVHQNYTNDKALADASREQVLSRAYRDAGLGQRAFDGGLNANYAQVTQRLHDEMYRLTNEKFKAKQSGNTVSWGILDREYQGVKKRYDKIQSLSGNLPKDPGSFSDYITSLGE